LPGFFLGGEKKGRWGVFKNKDWEKGKKPGKRIKGNISFDSTGKGKER